MEIKDYYRVNCKIAKRLRNRRPDIYELHILYKMFTPRVQFLHNSDNDFIYASIDYLSQKGVKINTINCKLDSTSKTLNVKININSIVDNGKNKDKITHVIFKVPGEFSKNDYNKMSVSITNELELKKYQTLGPQALIDNKTTVTDPILGFPFVGLVEN
jgi:hypothetical protein